MHDLQKFEKIIPVGKKEYAYQCENVETICTILGRIPSRGGSQPYLNDEKDEVNSYKLEIVKFTGNSLTVNLRKYKKDGSVQLFQFGCDFAHLVNQIFKNQEVNEFDGKWEY